MLHKKIKRRKRCGGNCNQEPGIGRSLDWHKHTTTARQHGRPQIQPQYLHLRIGGSSRFRFICNWWGTFGPNSQSFRQDMPTNRAFPSWFENHCPCVVVKDKFRQRRRRLLRRTNRSNNVRLQMLGSVKLIQTSDFGLHLLTKAPSASEVIFHFGGGLSGHHGKVTGMAFCGGTTEDSTRYIATVSGSSLPWRSLCLTQFRRQDAHDMGSSPNSRHPVFP